MFLISGESEFQSLELSVTTDFCVSTDEHAIRFIPKENGVHSIDVSFNGCHIPNSPFKICVGEPGQVGDPGLVSAYGTGLEGGTTGANKTNTLRVCSESIS